VTATKFLTLGDAVLDEAFPEVDLALRRGRHVDREETAWFGFLVDAADVLEPFYRRFGAELVYRTDGYYYLLPTGDKLAKRQLSVAEMLVGQALTLLYLDPATVEQGGRVRRDQVLAQLATVMGTDALVRALNPKRRRYDERVAQETVRARVADALRRLAALGFVEALGAEELKLRPALLRFAEPVRAASDSTAALARLVASGELSLTPLAEEPDGDDGELDEERAEPADLSEFGDETDAAATPESADPSDPSEPRDRAGGAELDEGLPGGVDLSEFDDFGFEDVPREPPAELAGELGLEEPE
jgi:chromosome partition protein MukE